MATTVEITNTTEGGIKNTIDTNDIIKLSGGKYTGENNTGIQIAKSKNITITSNDTNNKAIIDGSNITSFINNKGDLTLINLILQNFNGNNGGAIYNEGNLIIINCTFLNNYATNGASIYNQDGSQTISNSNFINNTASYGGGAIYHYRGIQDINNSNFRYNTGFHGGAIIYIYGNQIINNSNFTNNSASYGGAIFNHYSNQTITNSNFINNTATEGGGAFIQIGFVQTIINLISQTIVQIMEELYTNLEGINF